jgi:hypothetical protein
MLLNNSDNVAENSLVNGSQTFYLCSSAGIPVNGKLIINEIQEFQSMRKQL